MRGAGGWQGVVAAVCIPCKKVFLSQRPGCWRDLGLLRNDLQPRILYLGKLPNKMWKRKNKGKTCSDMQGVKKCTSHVSLPRKLVEDLHQQDKGVNPESRHHGSSCMKFRQAGAGSKSVIALARVTQLVGATSGAPEDVGFNFQLGHMSRSCVQSHVRASGN